MTLLGLSLPGSHPRLCHSLAASDKLVHRGEGHCQTERNQGPCLETKRNSGKAQILTPIKRGRGGAIPRKGRGHSGLFYNNGRFLLLQCQALPCSDAVHSVLMSWNTVLRDQIIFVALLGRKQRELWESTKAMIPLDFGIFVDSVILDMIQVFLCVGLYILRKGFMLHYKVHVFWYLWTN